MGYFLGWIILSIVVGSVGSSRRIGFFVAFLVSLFLSPLIGFIVVALSKSNSTIAYEKQMLDFHKQQTERINPPPPTVSEQLEALKLRRDNGEITMDEFRQARDKLLGNLL